MLATFHSAFEPLNFETEIRIRLSTLMLLLAVQYYAKVQNLQRSDPSPKSSAGHVGHIGGLGSNLKVSPRKRYIPLPERCQHFALPKKEIRSYTGSSAVALKVGARHKILRVANFVCHWNIEQRTGRIN